MDLRSNRRTLFQALAVLALVLATCGGCSTVRVHRARVAASFDRSASFLTARLPGPITAEVLDRHELATRTGLVSPGIAAEKLIESGAATDDPDGALALADLRAKQARRDELFAPADAPGLYLDAIEAITVAMNREQVADPDRIRETQRIYNDAVTGFLRSTGGAKVRLDAAWRERLAERGIEVRVGEGGSSWNPETFDHFDFTGDYKIRGLREPIRREGLGVPLIAVRHTPAPNPAKPPEGADRFYPRRLQAYPATALLRAERADDGKRRVVTLDLLDPMRVDGVNLANAERPPRRLDDPARLLLQQHPLPQITQVGLLRPGDLEKETGLYLLHPYEPGKIPVVLIHGLWSSPETWHQALDELRGDPELRDRYQFWVYFYPTGDPFLYSATKLRHALDEVRQALDPNRADPAFDQTVLVGHSMGGLLTRLMVVDSGTSFWDSIANQPFGDLQSGPGQRELLSKVFFFQSNPSISRVIFIATPHRGSNLSGAWIGRLGNALIRLPGMFEATQRDLIAQNDKDFFKNNRVGSPTTSITQLSPSSGALAALNERPIMPSLIYHSIIADAGSQPLELSNDHVVSYHSSHLDGAASEKIVKGTHACLNSEETIEEIRRILALHLREKDPITIAQKDEAAVRVANPSK